ncbi:hypothetical protein GNE08_08485 [Trichormus variabilis ARAD]|uniref:Uncharacterized protein n=1 Tax=Trichormus variabilis N2B TaxID=2681315 RepID=A0ABR6S8N3_ANAVA|nr:MULTISPECIES: hypothetical protein [Nostocaceae]MBC1214261.1 hypothetical protein [Trichormus variabilis ARAD]MBC1255367.1 hypothetical protein [Trichormus variabilis V5]MBC1268880.1 hypothetical protein [Trichormus variabilis FSR]MBC1302766.1 hypothetical protein [Trichormus variabilis N2B]MBC1325101.1 hypothetical protein [Trichormus variabilis 9RC]
MVLLTVAYLLTMAVGFPAHLFISLVLDSLKYQNLFLRLVADVNHCSN